MIRAYVGLLGQGKTLTMIYDALQEMEKGRQVFSNTPFAKKVEFNKGLIHKILGKKRYTRILSPIFLETKDEFIRVFEKESDGVFCIDEASIVFSNRNWDSIPPQIIMKMRQSRKDKLDIYYTAQDFMDCEVILRRITDEVCECKYRKRFGIPLMKKYELINNFWDKKYFRMNFVTPFMEEKFFLGERLIAGKKLEDLYIAYDTNYKIKYMVGVNSNYEKAKNKILQYGILNTKIVENPKERIFSVDYTEAGFNHIRIDDRHNKITDTIN